MSSEEHDLIRRLREMTEDLAGDAPAPSQSPPAAPPQPEGATFVVHDDWDHARRAGRAIAVPTLDARARLRAALRDPDSRLRRLAMLALFGLAVVGGLAGFGVALIHVINDPLADARAYYDAATRLNAGRPLYPPGIDVSSNLAYFYPPLFAIVLRPLALLPYEWFALVWEAVVVLSFVLLVLHLGVRSMRTWIAIGLLGIPIGWCLSIAQAHVPMTLLLAIGQPWSVALAANLKLFPALAALWWIGRRDWQATVAFVLWGAVLAAVQVLVEPRGTGDFLRTVGPGQLGDVRNISPFALAPELWVAFVVAGVLLALVLARSRAGWPTAVALATLASPRLLVYMLMGLLAAMREPKQANLEEPQPRPWLMVSGSGRH